VIGVEVWRKRAASPGPVVLHAAFNSSPSVVLGGETKLVGEPESSRKRVRSALARPSRPEGGGDRVLHRSRHATVSQLPRRRRHVRPRLTSRGSVPLWRRPAVAGISEARVQARDPPECWRGAPQGWQLPLEEGRGEALPRQMPLAQKKTPPQGAAPIPGPSAPPRSDPQAAKFWAYGMKGAATFGPPQDARGGPHPLGPSKVRRSAHRPVKAGEKESRANGTRLKEGGGGRASPSG